MKPADTVLVYQSELDYLEMVGGILVHEFGLQHIGEWHSHHQLGLAHPSGHDARTIYDNMFLTLFTFVYNCLIVIRNKIIDFQT